MKVSFKMFYLAKLYSTHSCLGENITSCLKMATVQEKAMCVRWFCETKSVVKMQLRYRTRYRKDLYWQGAERPSTSQEDVDRIQEEFCRSPQKSTGRASLQLDTSQTTVWSVVHNRFHLHAYNMQTAQALSRMINSVVSNLPKTFCQTSKLMKMTFRDGYSVMKQRFTYQGGWIIITAEYGDHKPLSSFEKSKDTVQTWMSGVVCHV
jgi:hypothetical protein